MVTGDRGAAELLKRLNGWYSDEEHEVSRLIRMSEDGGVVAAPIPAVFAAAILGSDHAFIDLAALRAAVRGLHVNEAFGGIERSDVLDLIEAIGGPA